MIRPVLFGVVIAAPNPVRNSGSAAVWSACAAGCFTLRLALQCRPLTCFLRVGADRGVTACSASLRWRRGIDRGENPGTGAIFGRCRIGHANGGRDNNFQPRRAKPQGRSFLVAILSLALGVLGWRLRSRSDISSRPAMPQQDVGGLSRWGQHRNHAGLNEALSVAYAGSRKRTARHRQQVLPRCEALEAQNRAPGSLILTRWTEKLAALSPLPLWRRLLEDDCRCSGHGKR